MKSIKLLATSWTTLALFPLASCGHVGMRCSASPSKATVQARAPVKLEPARLTSAQACGGPYRILLEQPLLARLKEAARLRSAAFVNAQRRADEALAKPLESGYQGFEWADAVASSALLWHATSDARYAESGLRYLRALLEDRLVLGDGKGGADVVQHDSGYGMRTFGAYSALGYDWLRDAPGMTNELKARVRQRLSEWIGWYQREGYLRDRPLANYYWGYLTALSFAGMALGGEAPDAAQWLQTAQSALARDVLPAFRDQLRGGGWPEGWQYGEYTALEVSLVARAFHCAAGVDVAGRLPWLSQTVTHHVHALLPDEKSVYDGGTWGEHPARPSALAMSGFALALEGVDDARAAEARWMVAHALPPLQREQAWLALLADAPGTSERPPRQGAPTSLHLPGQGLTFVRSDWSPAAVWASFQAGPPLAEDHQDADQGHFELSRGSDQLLVDGGGSEGSATINHNTLLIDDAGENLNYPPNQGVWGTDVKTTRFGDDGLVAVAVGEIGDAYSPKCAINGCSKRAVEKLTRSFVFVRPALLIIDDRMALTSRDYSATWAAHMTAPPKLDGDLASVVIGASRLDIRTLEPEHAVRAALHEPTPSGEGSHRLNQPWGPMWRLEVSSPHEAKERKFLHVITALPAAAAPPSVRSLRGDGLSGAAMRLEGSEIAVLFAGAKAEGHVGLAGGADTLIIVGLEPGKRYAVAVDPAACSLRLRPSAEPTSLQATSGGFIRSSAKCGGT